MLDLQKDWIRERAAGLSSCAADAPLTDSERSAVDAMIGHAGVVALGEAVHGSASIIHAADRILRFLIGDRGVDIVILEACAGAAHALDRHVTSGVGGAEEAVVATVNWNCASQEFLRLVRWLRDHNVLRSKSRRPVRVFGCDCQSIDGPKEVLLSMLQEFVNAGGLPESVAAAAAAQLTTLPTDRQLGQLVDLMTRDLEPNVPVERRVSEIEAWQSAFAATVAAPLEATSTRLRSVAQSLAADVSGDDLFMFERCVRLLEQVVAFYSPGDAIMKRDEFMAENVLALRSHFGTSRLLVYAHNVHVARRPWSVRGCELKLMGYHLAQQLGVDYRVIGSAFYSGEYLAMTEYRAEDEVIEKAHTPGPLAFESSLRHVATDRGSTGLLVPLGEPEGQDGIPPWSDGVEMRIGESGRKGSYEDCFVRIRPEQQYDGVVFVEESHPIAILSSYYIRAAQQWDPRGE